MMLNSSEGDNWTAVGDTPLERLYTMNVFFAGLYKGVGSRLPIRS